MRTRFFCSWTRVDPEFQLYDDEASILLSPSILAKSWDIRKWSKLPSTLYIDSGIYTDQKSRPSVESILESQVRITQNTPDIPVYYSHPDILLLKGLDQETLIHSLNENLERAAEYLTLFYQRRINGVPVGVIHGLDPETIYLTHQRLVDLGYEYFAIGSLSVRITHHRSMVIDLLQFILDSGIKPLHVLGLTLPLIDEFEPGSFASFDTAAAIKLAHNGSVLYRAPIRRYILRPNAYNNLRANVYSFRTPLEEPLECDCPVCRVDSEQLVGDNNSIVRVNRSIHNYFMLKRETEERS